MTSEWQTNDDGTPMQRLKGQIRCVRLLQWAGIPPVVPEHVALAKRLRPRHYGCPNPDCSRDNLCDECERWWDELAR